MSASLTFATRSDLTPRQGTAIDALPATWEVTGRVDSDLALEDMICDPDPYDPPPVLVLVRDPHGHTWQIDRDGNLDEFNE